MKRATLVLVSLVAASMFAFVACDDEPTQQEANEDFCDATAELITSLRAIRDLDRNSTLEEIEDARERARNAHDAMIEASQDVVDARLDDLESEWDELQDAVNSLEPDTTLADALDEVDNDLEDVASEAAQILNDVDCSGVGSESPSDE